MSCKDEVNGKKCTDVVNDKTCAPFQLTKLTNDSCFIDGLVGEALNIGSADLHVFKLLGIHEQGQLVDYAGTGTALSGGAASAYPATNAFNSLPGEWRSLQVGNNVLTTAYLGYDFGSIKLENGRERYGIDTNVRHHITTIVIKQGINSQNRVTKARVERSTDGINWYGVAVATLPDNDQNNIISFKESSPDRFWRIRPITFNGGISDSWNVQQLQLIDYRDTKLTNLQDDLGYLESRDRDYSSQSTLVKAYYDLIDIQTELTRFGIDMPSQQFFLRIHFNACVEQLGRPIVIGDLLELPSETQYSPTLEAVKKYLEVTDVAWDTAGYTPGWQPTMLRIIAQPALATQETQDIFGDLVPSIDDSGLIEVDTTKYVDIKEVDDKIQSAAQTNTPERGEDTADIQQFDAGTPQEKLNTPHRKLYVEDGLPPNGELYTEGDTLPVSPSDGDYHRLTFTAHDVPTRLYRYSLVKGRWIYLETDRRFEFNRTKPVLQSFLGSDSQIAADKLAK